MTHLITNGVYRFNVRTGQHEQVQCIGDIPCSRVRHSSAVANHFLLIHGGQQQHTRDTEPVITSTVYALHTHQHVWVQLQLVGPSPLSDVAFVSLPLSTLLLHKTGAYLMQLEDVEKFFLVRCQKILQTLRITLEAKTEPARVVLVRASREVDKIVARLVYDTVSLPVEMLDHRRRKLVEAQVTAHSKPKEHNKERRMKQTTEHSDDDDEQRQISDEERCILRLTRDHQRRLAVRNAPLSPLRFQPNTHRNNGNTLPTQTLMEPMKSGSFVQRYYIQPRKEQVRRSDRRDEVLSRTLDHYQLHQKSKKGNGESDGSPSDSQLVFDRLTRDQKPHSKSHVEEIQLGRTFNVGEVLERFKGAAEASHSLKVKLFQERVLKYTLK